MDNPRIYTQDLIHLGDNFVYKGDYCTVVKVTEWNFQYKIQGSNTQGYMSFSHYMTTPSYMGKQRYRQL